LLAKFYKHNGIEAGTDEAGRGCLAGPVFAAAVILAKDYTLAGLRDSKQLSAVTREALFDDIKAEAIGYCIAQVSPGRIDEINILNASIEAMHKSIAGLKRTPDRVLVDGNRFKPFKDIEFKCFVKGDDRFMAIAAASILAKVARDRFMVEASKEFPQYGWERNKGYPTKEHREAIRKYGTCRWHRHSFRLLNEQLEIGF